MTLIEKLSNNTSVIAVGANEASQPQTLLPVHREHLRKNGLSDDTISAARFYSVIDSGDARCILGWDGDCSGLVPSIAFPSFDRSGSILLTILRPDSPRLKDGKPVKYESPRGQSPRLYFPPEPLIDQSRWGDRNEPLILTEGIKKALAAAQVGFLAISAQGVYVWHDILIKKKKDLWQLHSDFKDVPIKGRRVYICFDGGDTTHNSNVKQAEAQLHKMLIAAGADVRLVRVPYVNSDVKVGLDDYLASQDDAKGALTELLATSIAVNEAQSAVYEYRKGEGHLAVQNGIMALSKVSNIFQRAQSLVSIVSNGHEANDSGVEREMCLPVIAPISVHRIWELLSETFPGIRYDLRSKKRRPCDPPDRVVNAIHARKEWPGIRFLDGFITVPALRPDGSLNLTPGYDAATKLFYVPNGAIPEIKNYPTRDDAVIAANALLEVVINFPFEGKAARSAWLAALLSSLAWTAYRGGAPLFAFDAHTPSSGKTLACDVIATIVTGHDLARSPYVEPDDEMRKRITAHAIAGDTLVLIDNVPTGAQIGWASLDNALTSQRLWSDRILGKSELIKVPLNAVFFVTGNNMSLRSDTSRRTLKIRLNVLTDRPDKTTGFRHDPLREWVSRERSRLIAAALTLLRAYCFAGRPDQGLSAFGSFESWSDLVRNAIVWVGLADPLECLAANDSDSDSEQTAHVRLLVEWSALNGKGGGLTAREVIRLAESRPEIGDALIELCPGKNNELPDARALGNKLRALKGRQRKIEDGHIMSFSPASSRARGGAMRWIVRTTMQRSGESGDSDESVSDRDSKTVTCPRIETHSEDK